MKTIKKFKVLFTITLILLSSSSSSYAQSQPSPTQILSHFSSEPSVGEVQKAALQYAGLADTNLDAWSTRARWSNAIPRLQGQVAWLDQRDVQLRYREVYKTDDDGYITADPNQSNLADDARARTLYSIRASLDLGGLLYDRSEPIIAREVRSRLSSRDDILRRSTELYFTRRQRQVIRFLTPISDWNRHLELELEIQSLTAQLDAMTGGWLTQKLKTVVSPSPSQKSAVKTLSHGDAQ